MPSPVPATYSHIVLRFLCADSTKMIMDGERCYVAIFYGKRMPSTMMDGRQVAPMQTRIWDEIIYLIPSSYMS